MPKGYYKRIPKTDRKNTVWIWVECPTCRGRGRRGLHRCPLCKGKNDNKIRIPDE